VNTDLSAVCTEVCGVLLPLIGLVWRKWRGGRHPAFEQGGLGYSGRQDTFRRPRPK